MRNRTFNNPKLDIVNINAYIKFGENLSICTQDIVRNEIMTDEQTDGQTDNPHPI